MIMGELRDKVVKDLLMMIGCLDKTRQEETKILRPPQGIKVISLIT
jgi:hypothetical protein